MKKHKFVQKNTLKKKVYHKKKIRYTYDTVKK